MSSPAGLHRFVAAQEGVYARVCAELRAGRKESHWMWFIFPQLRGLGRLETARYYSLADLAEARAYDRHPLLGERLRECVGLVLEHPDTPIGEIMGRIDALKLRSCATLFETAAGDGGPFSQVLETFFDGMRCEVTVQAMEAVT